MAGPALIVGGKILAGAASLLYNSITGAKEAQAPAPTFEDNVRSVKPLKRPKSSRGRKAASSAEKSG